MSDAPVLKLLDTVALLVDLPDRGLVRGQVGTVVERHDRDTVEVEFADLEGRTHALAAIPVDRLLLLHDQPART